MMAPSDSAENPGAVAPPCLFRSDWSRLGPDLASAAIHVADRIEIRWLPFPLRSFVWIGIVWAVIDLAALGLLWQLRYSWNDSVELLGEAWSGIQSAKVMLLLGWFFLGSGQLQQRLWGLVVFAPLVLFALARGGFSDVLGSLFCMSLVAIPGSYLVGLPYLLLRANDHRLMQGVVDLPQTRRQFTVRQLLVVTFAAAVVLGLLRLAGQTDPQVAMFATVLIVLPWAFPLLSCVGLLSLRWNNVTLSAICMATFQLALPMYVLERDQAAGPAVVIASYTLFFLSHVLLLRGLGFRLVEQRLLRFPNEITFLEPDATGIQFVDGRRPERFE